MVNPQIRVFELTPYLTCFYAGRDGTAAPRGVSDWRDEGALHLGIGLFTIHLGSQAVVYDTFTGIEEARFVRSYLEAKGVRNFTVVYSHWHLDHIAGSEVFADCDFVATALTRDALLKHKTAIEDGTLWGPPAIANVRIPNVAFDDDVDIRIGDVDLQLRRYNIHSIDGCAIYIPADGVLLAGDTLEDPITYIIEPEHLPAHITELRRMQMLDIKAIFPNHGNPEVIAGGGYGRGLIEATRLYVERMLARCKDADYLDQPMENFIGPELAKGWVHAFEPYRDVHTANQKLVADYWKDKALPDFVDDKPNDQSAVISEQPNVKAPRPAKAKRRRARR